MGTPAFAVPTLVALVEAGYPIEMVVTQPDKKVGRKQILTPPAVKVEALKHGLRVYQPRSVKKRIVQEKLAAVEADLFVVIAYGKILPQAVLDMPKRGCINIHGSLLPDYRGAAPIQWSIVRGEKETGITTMLMDVGMDTGDMLLKRSIAIAFDDTTATLAEKLSTLGSELILETIPKWISGELEAQKQDDDKATYAPLIAKSDGEIKWGQSAQDIYNLIRGFTPWPEAFTMFKDKTLKIKKAQLVSDPDPERGVPGQIIAVNKQDFLVRTGEGVLAVTHVQLSGSKAMDAGTFARGQRLEPGEILANIALC